VIVAENVAGPGAAVAITALDAPGSGAVENVTVNSGITVSGRTVTLQAGDQVTLPGGPSRRPRSG